jgi:hypothetical protein
VLAIHSKMNLAIRLIQLTPVFTGNLYIQDKVFGLTLNAGEKRELMELV